MKRFLGFLISFLFLPVCILATVIEHAIEFFEKDEFK